MNFQRDEKITKNVTDAIAIDEKLKKQNEEISCFLNSSSGKKLIYDTTKIFKSHILFLASNEYIDLKQQQIKKQERKKLLIRQQQQLEEEQQVIDQQNDYNSSTDLKPSRQGNVNSKHKRGSINLTNSNKALTGKKEKAIENQPIDSNIGGKRRGGKIARSRSIVVKPIEEIKEDPLNIHHEYKSGDLQSQQVIVYRIHTHICLFFALFLKMDADPKTLLLEPGRLVFIFEELGIFLEREILLKVMFITLVKPENKISFIKFIKYTAKNFDKLLPENSLKRFFARLHLKWFYWPEILTKTFLQSYIQFTMQNPNFEFSSIISETHLIPPPFTHHNNNHSHNNINNNYNNNLYNSIDNACETFLYDLHMTQYEFIHRVLPNSTYAPEGKKEQFIWSVPLFYQLKLFKGNKKYKPTDRYLRNEMLLNNNPKNVIDINNSSLIQENDFKIQQIDFSTLGPIHTNECLLIENIFGEHVYMRQNNQLGWCQLTDGKYSHHLITACKQIKHFSWNNWKAFRKPTYFRIRAEPDEFFHNIELKIRNFPLADSEVIGHLKSGDIIYSRGVLGDWLHIRYHNNEACWILHTANKKTNITEKTSFLELSKIFFPEYLFAVADINHFSSQTMIDDLFDNTYNFINQFLISNHKNKNNNKTHENNNSIDHDYSKTNSNRESNSKNRNKNKNSILSPPSLPPSTNSEDDDDDDHEITGSKLLLKNKYNIGSNKSNGSSKGIRGFISRSAKYIADSISSTPFNISSKSKNNSNKGPKKNNYNAHLDLNYLDTSYRSNNEIDSTNETNYPETELVNKNNNNNNNNNNDNDTNKMNTKLPKSSFAVIPSSLPVLHIVTTNDGMKIIQLNEEPEKPKTPPKPIILPPPPQKKKKPPLSLLLSNKRRKEVLTLQMLRDADSLPLIELLNDVLQSYLAINTQDSPVQIPLEKLIEISNADDEHTTYKNKRNNNNNNNNNNNDDGDSEERKDSIHSDADDRNSVTGTVMSQDYQHTDLIHNINNNNNNIVNNNPTYLKQKRRHNGFFGCHKDTHILKDCKDMHNSDLVFSFMT